MKTEISRFCEVCLNHLQALPAALKTATAQMETATDQAHLQGARTALDDINARTRSLVEKLANQQAYLLIFGPLKSGKSTLMNAISGSYVSEVTSLPGYPCLVYVQHSNVPRFSLTRYNGRESVYADAVILKDVIADSHVALAQQIRATEVSGEQFDPRTHFAEAIRRIDVKVPVPTLAESSTVLVDTPGLYSRMNFGYDVLTREFRDSAACAVFVVKADNLFLEQVFAEFNQLLGLFSRIFLLINVDAGKRDLQPDGSLLPSAESQNPAQIIEAFKTLSMAGPLRQAYDDGRLRLHAVDLMSAASAVLTRNSGTPSGDQQQHHQQRAAFESFLADLTDYLNSSDYTVEFIRDSLRQGLTLCREVGEVFKGSEVARLEATILALSAEMQDLDARIAAVDRLLTVNWNAAFEKVRSQNASRGRERFNAKAQYLAAEMRQGLGNWYGAEDCLQALVDKYWNTSLAAGALALEQETQARLHGFLENSSGGAEPVASVMMDLNTVNFSLGQISQAALSKLDAKDDPEAYLTAINAEAIPVRKSLGDWLLFRKIAKVRRRLFGDGALAPIAPALKLKRLPELSRDVFLRMIDDAIRNKIPSLPAKYSERLLQDYVECFRQELLEALRRQRQHLVRERADRQIPYNVNTQIMKVLESLYADSQAVATALKPMAVPDADESAWPSAPAVAAVEVPGAELGAELGSELGEADQGLEESTPV